MEPSDLRPRLCATPPAAATKPVLGAGTHDCPKFQGGLGGSQLVPAPHATIEPSALIPRLWKSPAAMPTKPMFGAGIWPQHSNPHATTDPIDCAQASRVVSSPRIRTAAHAIRFQSLMFIFDSFNSLTQWPALLVKLL